MTAPNIADLKERLDILTVAEHLGAEPRRESGTVYGVRHNPIRDEKSPSNSFKLYADTNRFMDFSTGQNGDIFDLIAAAKNLSLNEAKGFALSLIGGHYQQHEPRAARAEVVKTEIDLVGMDRALKAALQKQLDDRGIQAQPYVKELYELIARDVLRYALSDKVFKFLGWSEKYQSLTVTLYDNDGIPQAICIRHAADSSGEVIKWKTYGAKTFCPCRMEKNDSLIFVASGIAELLIFELLGVDYFILQSDGIKPDREKVKSIFKGSLAVFVLDNDTSCKAAFEAFKSIHSDTVAVDFQTMLDKELPKGYDLRDFANETAQRLNDENGIMPAATAAGETVMSALMVEVEKCLKGGDK